MSVIGETLGDFEDAFERGKNIMSVIADTTGGGFMGLGMDGVPSASSSAFSSANSSANQNNGDIILGGGKSVDSEKIFLYMGLALLGFAIIKKMK